MTNYTPLDVFSAVHQYDTSDPVLGGNDGESNQPVQQLANRTEYLYNRLGGFQDVVPVTGNANISANHANKLIVAEAGTNITLNLASVSGFIAGNKIAIAAIMSGVFWVNLVAADNIAQGTVIQSNIWIYDGEMIELIAAGNRWIWTVRQGNWDKVGLDELKRKQPRNTFLADGTNNNLREQYPRLWAAIGGNAVPDSSWVSDPFRYRGFYSTGNGSTTFRRPDLRAMSIRALDLGRGVSLGRFSEDPGGYEKDQILEHDHPLPVRSELDSLSFRRILLNVFRMFEDFGGSGISANTIHASGKTGGSENTIKNIGFLPVIYY